MSIIRILLLTAAIAGGAVAADLACETNNSASATYNWNNTSAWNCYSQGRVPVPNEYPGKNYPSNNYIVILGLTTNANVVTEHDMNVNSTLGIGGRNYAKWTVSSAADNGSGLIRVTTGANTVATGDKVYCHDFNGTNGAKAYGVWVATAVSTTQFDLQGSSFSGISGVTTGTCEFPAAVKRQGYASNANTVGKWWIKPGVEVVLRGDVIDAWNYTTKLDESFALVRCGDSSAGGCTWTWDGTGPYSYQTNWSSVVNIRNFRFVFRGIPAAHALVRSYPVAKPGLFGGAGISGDLYADFADFDHLGNPGTATPSFTSSLEASSTFNLTHFTWTAMGHYVVGNTTPLAASGGVWNVSYGVIDPASCSTGFGCFYNLKAPGGAGSGNTLKFGPALVFNAIAPPIQTATNPGAVVFDYCYFAYPPNVIMNARGGNAGSAAQNSIIARPASTVGSQAIFGLENMLNNFVWQAHDPTNGGNPHNLWFPDKSSSGYVYSAQPVVDGNVFQLDGAGTDNDGNQLDEAQATLGALSPTYVTVKNNFFLPNFEFDGQPATQWHSSNSLVFVTNVPNLFWKFYNNTIFAITSNGAVHLGHVSAFTPAGKIAEFRCNALAQSPAGVNGYIVGVETVAGSATDTATPSGLHHNAAFGVKFRANNAALQAANGTRYNFIATSAPGTADIYFDNRMPQVVDFTRRLRTWASQKYGRSFADDDAVLTYMRADLTRLLDIADLVSWIKAGWVLNEPSLFNACGDGTHIGAAVASAPVNPGVSRTVVARSGAPLPAALD